MSRAGVPEGVADHRVPLSEILWILRDRCHGYVRLTETPRAEPHDIRESPRGEHVAPRDRALWMGARFLQEHGNVFRQFAEKARQRGHNEVAEHYEAQARERDQDAAALRDCLARQPEPSASRR